MQIIKTVTVADALTGFSRASTGTYWDKTGVLQTAAANVLRMSYDPSDLGAAPQPLIETAATNFYVQSQNFGAADWTSSAAAIALDVAVAPDGTTSADSLTNTTGAYSFIRQPVGLQNSTTYTRSLFVKPMSGLCIPVFEWVDNGNYGYAVFDIGAMQAYLSAGSVDSKSSLRIESFANGWYRVEHTFTTGAIGGQAAQALFINAVGAAASSGTFAAWGAQIEIGSAASSPIPTGATTVTRSADTLGTGVGLLYSNVVENDTDDGPVWSAGATYTTGQTVRRPNHRKYYALQAVPAGATPETNTSGTTPYWQDIGPTSTWSVFDATYSTVADAADYVTYILRPGQVCTSLAVVGMDASSVRVTMIDSVSGVTVYNTPKALRMKNSRSISEYLFGEIERRTDEVFDDLPPFKSAIVTVTVAKLGGQPALGDLQFGRLEDIGETQWKPEIRTLRRSLIEDDGFGNIKFTKRRSSKLITADVSVDTARVDYVVRMLNAYTDTPCVIIGDARWTSLIILGFVQDFRLVLENDGADGALYNAQIQGFA